MNAIAHGKLTPEFVNLFCNMIAHGHYIETACKAMRVSSSTFQSWMRTGKNDVDGVYRDFYERVMQADAAAETYALDKWRSYFDKDWKASATFLARRFPDRWSERRYIKLAVDRELESMMRELQQRLPEDVFLLVLNELASIDESRHVQSVESIDSEISDET